MPISWFTGTLTPALRLLLALSSNWFARRAACASPRNALQAVHLVLPDSTRPSRARMALVVLLALAPLAAAPTCTMLMDNVISQIYVDGVDVTSSVTGSLSWSGKGYLTFSDGARLLALKAYDAEAGCPNGGFMMSCTSSDPRWVLDTRDVSPWLVYGSSSSTNPSNDASGNAWYSLPYNAHVRII